MPDVELKPQVYKDPRPKEYFDRVPRARARPRPEPVYEIVRVLTVLHALITFARAGLGRRTCPTGPVILAPNHASFMDHFFTGAFIRRRVQFMAKSQMFKPPLGRLVYSHGGRVPGPARAPRRGGVHHLVRDPPRGGAIVMYCEGAARGPASSPTRPSPGIGRLALQTGVPVVPVAILGSYQVRNWKRLHFPKVTVQYGTPFKFEALVEHRRATSSRRRPTSSTVGSGSCTPSSRG